MYLSLGLPKKLIGSITLKVNAKQWWNWMRITLWLSRTFKEGATQPVCL